MRIVKLWVAVAGVVAVATAQTAERRARIDVISTKVQGAVNPATQSIQATATLEFTPLDANVQTITLDLNDALKSAISMDKPVVVDVVTDTYAIAPHPWTPTGRDFHSYQKTGA